MDNLTKSEKEVIANIIARNIVNQLRNNEECTGKNNELNNCSKDDVKKLFKGVILSESALALFLSLPYESLINAVFTYISLKKSLKHIINRNTIIDTSFVKKFLLISDKKFEKIIKRTELINETFMFEFDDWKSIVLSSKFDLLYERILKISEIINNKKIQFIIIKDIIFDKSEENFIELSNRLLFLYEKYGDQALEFIIVINSSKFYSVEKQISHIISQHIPILSELEIQEIINVCLNFTIKEQVIRANKIQNLLWVQRIPFEWIASNEFIANAEGSVYYILLTTAYNYLEKISADYKKHIEKLEKEKQEKYRRYVEKEKRESISNGRYKPLEIGRFCTGNCSMCKRENCVNIK